MRTKSPHDDIEFRLLILIFGATMLFGGKRLWINIIGAVFVAFAILRIVWRDIYKASRA